MLIVFILYFSISLNPSGGGGWASSGEDGCVRLWAGGDCVREIRLPVHSVWSVACMDNGDIVTGNNTHITILIFPIIN